jgi:hypothetical protein
MPSANQLPRSLNPRNSNHRAAQSWRCIPRPRVGLGFVTRPQMIAALVREAESTAPGVTVVDVPAIRAADVTGLSLDGNPVATNPG